MSRLPFINHSKSVPPHWRRNVFGYGGAADECMVRKTVSRATHCTYMSLILQRDAKCSDAKCRTLGGGGGGGAGGATAPSAPWLLRLCSLPRLSRVFLNIFLCVATCSRRGI